MVMCGSSPAGAPHDLHHFKLLTAPGVALPERLDLSPHTNRGPGLTCSGGTLPIQPPATRSSGSDGQRSPGRSSAAILSIGPRLIGSDRLAASVLPLPHSLPAGGSAFAEDPAHSCASVLPIWSQVADPRVLVVRATPARAWKNALRSYRFDLDRISGHVLVDDGLEHVRLDHPTGVIRLDVVSGSLRDGPVNLTFELVHSARLSIQLSALRDFDMLSVGRGIASPDHRRLLGSLAALQTVDARTAGASLRNIADLLLGEGDWPGDGEHRKSRVRRMLALGAQLLRAGPLPILSMR